MGNEQGFLTAIEGFLKKLLFLYLRLRRGEKDHKSRFEPYLWQTLIIHGLLLVKLLISASNTPPSLIIFWLRLQLAGWLELLWL